MMMKCNVYYAYLNAADVFGMVGRCGGGYNTVWEDWTPVGQANRNLIIKEFEEGINQICGHYTKLEESIISEGFRNPIVVTCGAPVRRKPSHLPPHLRTKPKNELLLLEGTTGGSRLWVAQKLGMMIPAIVNDWTGAFSEYLRITEPTDALRFYKDPPKHVYFDTTLGFVEAFDQHKVGYHLGLEWSEEKIVVQRAPLWVKTMNKYGYYVHGLPAFVNEILRNAGVVQPDSLR